MRTREQRDAKDHDDPTKPAAANSTQRHPCWPDQATMGGDEVGAFGAVSGIMENKMDRKLGDARIIHTCERTYKNERKISLSSLIRE